MTNQDRAHQRGCAKPIVHLRILLAGLVVPYGFAKNLQRGRPADVQVLLHAVNASTANLLDRKQPG